MDRIRIIGGNALRGVVDIGGAKNATLPLMAAALLTKDPLILRNVPDLADITSMAILLAHLGVDIQQHEVIDQKPAVAFQTKAISTPIAPYDLVRKMRASVLVLGPLLARAGVATVSLPGGCAIGTRPVDLHVKALQALGAEITLEEGYVYAKAPQELKGAHFTFPIKSVTGTENLLMAASLAKGTTVILNAAREPEISDLANCLVSMGAKIEGIGTDTLTIEGVSSLHGTTHSILPDRIETGTYAIAAAITHGCLDIQNTSLTLLPTFEECLQEIGVKITPIPDGFRVDATAGGLKCVDIRTDPFPGFPTDLQAQMMALMSVSEGASLINETIFENRFMHVPELHRLGADIQVCNASALVRGTQRLIGAPVMATDLRASVSLVLAGLVAQGETTVHRVYHLDRGYERIENKLTQCGAQIERIKGDGHDTENDQWAA